MAVVDDLPWRSLADLTTAVAAFLDPVLGGARGSWHPESWSWSE